MHTRPRSGRQWVGVYICMRETRLSCTLRVYHSQRISSDYRIVRPPKQDTVVSYLSSSSRGGWLRQRRTLAPAELLHPVSHIDCIQYFEVHVLRIALVRHSGGHSYAACGGKRVWLIVDRRFRGPDTGVPFFVFTAVLWWALRLIN